MATRVLLLCGVKVIPRRSPRAPVAVAPKMEIYSFFGDVTINPTAVNKVKSSDVCESAQISSSSTSLCVLLVFLGGIALFAAIFKANYFVHQKVTM